ncbi:MAG: ribonuclease HI family protein [Planctomycetes bacterium]|nr:ribonuclease HI family protein [Planctomycetota bacterium]
MGQNFEIHIDGASRGNPGPSGIGILIKDADDGTIWVQRGEFIGEVTNNVAEYTALIRALKIITGPPLNLKPETVHLTIKADSELVINQMVGNYRIKSENLVSLAIKARKAMKKFKSVELKLINRKYNKEADKLANKAMNLRDSVDELDEKITLDTGSES